MNTEAKTPKTIRAQLWRRPEKTSHYLDWHLEESRNAVISHKVETELVPMYEEDDDYNGDPADTKKLRWVSFVFRPMDKTWTTTEANVLEVEFEATQIIELAEQLKKKIQ